MESNLSFSTAAPVRDEKAIARFEEIDGEFLTLARCHRAQERQFPTLVHKRLLDKAEYPQAFPHLLMQPCACHDPEWPEPFVTGNLAPQEWYLSPAVCYHAYAHIEGETLDEPRILTARGRCYRREDHFQEGRRQLEFEMREIVMIGAPDWVDAKISEIRPEVDAIALSYGLPTYWETAEDPFFLPTAKGKALIQRLMETKKELICEQGGKLAIASINRHGAFFGERFSIRLPGGESAHTACIAFGLDRWAGLLGAAIS